MKNRFWKYVATTLIAITTLPAPSWAAGYTQTKYPVSYTHLTLPTIYSV